MRALDEGGLVWESSDDHKTVIARLYKAGDTVDEILESYPHLRPSWVHDAIGYYLDHQNEIEREIRESRMEYLAGMPANENTVASSSPLNSAVGN